MKTESVRNADGTRERPPFRGQTIPLLAAAMVTVANARGQEPVASFLAIPGDAQVTLTWTPSFEASGYNVKQGRSASGPFTMLATNVSVTSFIVANLTNDQAYYFAVSAVADEFESVNTPGLRATPSLAVLDLLPAGAKLEELATGCQIAEGPVWNPAEGGSLIFSDIDGNRMLRWTPGSGVTTFRQPSNRANGNTLDLQGRLLTCHQTTRSVKRTEPDGTVRPLVTEYNGKPFNEPNDVVVKSDGTVWFTDPAYTNHKTQPGEYVYRFDPEVGNASVTVVATNVSSPNGLCFSPDETRLYVGDVYAPALPGDKYPGCIWVYDVLPGNTVTNARVFAHVPYPDGFRADREGRIYTRAELSEGVVGLQLLDPDGRRVGAFAVPELPYNLCLGGTKQELLFITAETSVYGITRMPDLVVTAAYANPSSPKEGQRIIFSAVVKNQGTAPTPPGRATRVRFVLDGATNTAWSAVFNESIPPDASALLTVSGGADGPVWTATAGAHSLQATVDDLNQVSESNETNNRRNAGWGVSTSPTDSDGDGLDDESETIAGTDPRDRASVLRITSIARLDANQLALTWSSVPGMVYRVVRYADIAGPKWASCLSQVVAPEGATSLTRTVTDSGGLHFYRVLVVP